MVLEHGGRRIPVAAGDLLIGSDPGAGLPLAGEGVCPRHAVVRLLGDGLAVIQPAVPHADLMVNGARVGSDPVPLLHGDRVRIGNHEILVSDPRKGGETRMLSTVSPTAGRLAPGGRLVSLIDGREYPLRGSAFVMGRDAASQVVIASPDASRRHAEIVGLPAGDVLVDLSANGTYVNGERITARQPLKALDVIRIGAEEFRYYPAPRPEPEPTPVPPPPGAEFRLADTLHGFPTFRPSPEPAPAPPKGDAPLASLLVRSGTLKGERLQVLSPVVNLGRAEHNDLRLPDPSVSASHAKLQLREGVWMLSDLGSTNGTVVDGMPVAEEMPLSPGTTVKLGEVTMLFEPRDRSPARGGGTVVLSAGIPPPASVPAPASAAESAPRPREPQPPRARKPAPPPPPEPSRTPWIAVGLVLILLALVAVALLS